jgi:alcohol dehydrogenase/S-(hydroxymethyl)glutathione dehydrogenase/alcohol dehydrogenase
MVRAALLRSVGAPLEIVDAELAPPGPGHVRVALAASGVCHSDLSVANGTLPLGAPIVLGHEGAGVIAEIGPEVDGLAVGEHVVLSWVPQCGTCWSCRNGAPHLCTSSAGAGRHLSVDGEPVQQMMGLGTFATETTVPVSAVVRIPSDVPLAQAALVGCAVLTGAGAAMNTAHLEPGGSVAVIGCGGVGLNAVQGARLAGAKTIIAIDVQPEKLLLATRFGATHTIDATQVDPVARVRELTPGRGVDVAIEAIGVQATVDQAVQLARPGGQAVFVGIGGLAVNVSVPALQLIREGKSLTGCYYGSADVRRDVPRLLGHYADGDLLLDELITRRITLDEVNEAMELLQQGVVTRSVIEFASPAGTTGAAPAA